MLYNIFYQSTIDKQVENIKKFQQVKKVRIYFDNNIDFLDKNNMVVHWSVLSILPYFEDLDTDIVNFWQIVILCHCYLVNRYYLGYRIKYDIYHELVKKVDRKTAKVVRKYIRMLIRSNVVLWALDQQDKVIKPGMKNNYEINMFYMSEVKVKDMLNKI